MKDKKQGKDILSGKTILFEKELKMEARESLVVVSGRIFDRARVAVWN